MSGSKAVSHSGFTENNTAMDAPPTIQQVIQTLRPYINNYATPKPAFRKTLTGGREIETKIHITSQQEVIDTMESLRLLGLSGAEHRSERHEISELPDGAHISRVHIAGTKEVWLKTKSKNTPFYTSRYHYPMVCRSSKKLKPHDSDYAEAYKSIENLPIVKSFNKECINFFYEYMGAIYSLSFSLAWNNSGFLRQEMEFEYEGTADPKAKVSRSDTEHMIETMLRSCLPASLLLRMHAQTKYESLANIKTST